MHENLQRSTGWLTSLALVATLIFVFPFFASADHTADTDHDGFISVAEGVPFYGGIVSSLTTSGDTSASSALALDRFPVADENGEYEYERTFELSEEVDDLTEAHIVIHGYDIDESGAYDGDKESSIAEGVPFEATVPVACGVIEMDTYGEYTADLSQLNSSGVEGEVMISLHDGEVTISMEVEDASPGLPHAQHIHLGGSNECPPNTEGADMDDDDDNHGNPFNNARINAYERIIESLERAIERLQDRINEFQDKIDDLR